VISVCQPTVPVLAASVADGARGEATPRSLVMMGGPIDAAHEPTKVNDLAHEEPLVVVREQRDPRRAVQLPR
jgi:poly(3-hydroxybutyrate) depolymerase